MAISRGLILVDVLILAGAILVAVHIFKLTRGTNSDVPPASPTESEQTISESGN